mmetsp:Transcript_178565/g.572355  ORF Transcript_178565/g.572355 Transcript_178565/m.572355 type:complete len:599 (+) Transcript_178565:745-2541(+)
MPSRDLFVRAPTEVEKRDVEVLGKIRHSRHVVPVALPQSAHGLARRLVELQHPDPHGRVLVGRLLALPRRRTSVLSGAILSVTILADALPTATATAAAAGLLGEAGLHLVGCPHSLAQYLLGGEFGNVEAEQEVLAVQISEHARGDADRLLRHVDGEPALKTTHFILGHGLDAGGRHPKNGPQLGIVAHERPVAVAPSSDAGLAEIGGTIPGAGRILGVHVLDEDHVASGAGPHRIQNLHAVLPHGVDLVHQQNRHRLVARLLLDFIQKGLLRALLEVRELVLIDPNAAQEVPQHAAQRALPRPHQATNYNPKLPGRTAELRATTTKGCRQELPTDVRCGGLGRGIRRARALRSHGSHGGGGGEDGGLSLGRGQGRAHGRGCGCGRGPGRRRHAGGQGGGGAHQHKTQVHCLVLAQDLRDRTLGLRHGNTRNGLHRCGDASAAVCQAGSARCNIHRLGSCLQARVDCRTDLPGRRPSSGGRYENRHRCASRAWRREGAAARHSIYSSGWGTNGLTTYDSGRGQQLMLPILRRGSPDLPQGRPVPGGGPVQNRRRRSRCRRRRWLLFLRQLLQRSRGGAHELRSPRQRRSVPRRRSIQN